MDFRKRKQNLMLRKPFSTKSRFESKFQKWKKLFVCLGISCCLLLFLLVYMMFIHEVFVPLPPLSPYVIVSDKNRSPSRLENRLLEIFNEQRSGKTRFRGAYMPVDWNVGLGNDLLGLTNLVLFSLFTNSTFYIPPQFGFKSRKREYFQFLPFKNPLFHHYAMMPPNDERLRELIIHTNNDCLYNNKYEDPLSYLYNRRPKYFRYTDYKFKNFERSDDDIYPNWRRCNDDVCRDIITSSEHIFHDISNLPEGNVKEKLRNSNFHCLREWRNGYWAQHVFKSKPKVKYLCEDLQLCEGIEWKNIDYSNSPEGGYQKKGLRLVANIFNDLLEFNLDTFKHFDMSSSTGIHDDLAAIEHVKSVTDKIFSFQLRSHYAGTTKIEEMVTNCLLDFISEDVNLLPGSKVGLFFTTDIHPLNHHDFYTDIGRNIRIRTGIEIVPIYPYSLGGSTSQDVILKDSEEGDLAKRRVLYDIYVQTIADSHAITEQSTFGVWGAMISQTRRKIEESEKYDIRVFRDRKHFKMNDNEELTCVKGRPYLVCPKSACPYDFE